MAQLFEIESEGTLTVELLVSLLNNYFQELTSQPPTINVREKDIIMVASRHEAPEDPPFQEEDTIPDVIDPWGRRHPVESERFEEIGDGSRIRYVKYKDGSEGSSIIMPIGAPNIVDPSCC